MLSDVLLECAEGIEEWQRDPGYKEMYGEFAEQVERLRAMLLQLGVEIGAPPGPPGKDGRPLTNLDRN
jgi:hypothetical protein